jgi:hypothetical protein
LKLLNFNPQNYKSFDEWKGFPLIQPKKASLTEQEMTDIEAEAYSEYSASLLAEDIKRFIASPQSSEDYKDFVSYVFRGPLGTEKDDPVWKLLEYSEKETDFYTAPASTRFHSHEPGGLIRHSLLVVANGIKLAPVMLSSEVDMYHLVISCLFHDFCKVNMYEVKTRNVKNEETGNWEKAPYYSVRKDYIAFGHGIESMLRLNKYIPMPDSWNHAIRWHMGAYDLAPMDKPSLDKALALYREVLFLQAADMQAGLVEEI